MKRSLFSILALLLVVSLVLAACGGTTAPEPTEAPAESSGDMPYEGEQVVIFSAAGEDKQPYSRRICRF